MNNNYQKRAYTLEKTLVILDLIAIALVLYFVHHKSYVDALPTPMFIIQTCVLVGCYLLVFLGLGLYHSKLRETSLGILRRLLFACIIFYLLFSAISLLFEPPLPIYDSLIIFCAYSFVLNYLCRLGLYKFNVLGFKKRNVLILGAGKRAQIIEQRMRRKVDRNGFRIVGFIQVSGDCENEVANQKIIPTPDNLTDYVLKNNIHEVVIANDERRGKLPIDELFLCKLKGVKISDIVDFFEYETGQIAVNLLYPSWLIYSEGFDSNNEAEKLLNWVFNDFLAILVFLITWPFMLLAVIAIKIEDGLSAPCLYKQNRVGLDGKVFQIIKFRSMRVDAEKDGAKWAKTEDDRVTRVGKFMRKYRIDELPQLYNVITGDMGFVGPRPERPEFVTVLEPKIPYYKERHSVKSGLTGWAQLKYPYGSSEADAAEKLKYDLYYIKHRSFMFDLLILIQTAEIVLLGKGR